MMSGKRTTIAEVNYIRQHGATNAAIDRIPGHMERSTIVVLEGDETEQELLEEALHVLAPDVAGVQLELRRHDLSLASRAHRRPRRPHRTTEYTDEVIHRSSQPHCLVQTLPAGTRVRNQSSSRRRRGGPP